MAVQEEANEVKNVRLSIVAFVVDFHAALLSILKAHPGKRFLGDYVCPPSGLAMLWNAIRGNKRINWVQGAEHGYVPSVYEGRDVERKVVK